MFVDYYSILEVDIASDLSAIKAAFKKQAIRWHPDKNPGIDTTLRMQQINEAYLILKDADARKRYDVEYRIYKAHFEQNQKQYHRRNQDDEVVSDEQKSKTENPFEDTTYEILDDTLKRWMSNARIQAVDLARQTIEDLRGMSKVGGKAMAEAAYSGVFRYLIFAIIMFLIFKACQ
jgi:curved DNA-binding protein CbpA